MGAVFSHSTSEAKNLKVCLPGKSVSTGHSTARLVIQITAAV